MLADITAVACRHGDIKQDQVRQLRESHMECFSRIVGVQNFMALLGEEFGEGDMNGAVVVGDKNFHGVAKRVKGNLKLQCGIL